MAERVDLPQGTLETLILKTLTWGTMHGFGIGRWIEQASGDSLTIEEGSLYPALHRLERKGWLKGRWAMTANNRRAKYYELSKKGRTQLEAQVDTWRALSVALSDLLDLA